MKEKICEICKNIEKEKKIKILFAVENGSRAWRMESINSDYDVRFVFVRKTEEYLQIKTPEDVITRHYNQDFNPSKAEGCFIDIIGFDIFKFIRMLVKSNPTSIEWLTSDIIYYRKLNKTLVDFAKNSFNPIAIYYHYKSMCKNNYFKYLKSKNEVTYKKYLYAFRGLVNARWVANKKNLPPINFSETLSLSDFLPKHIINKLNEIIKLKKQGKEKDIIENIVNMDKYLEKFLLDDSEAPKSRTNIDLNELNEELKKIVINN